MARHQLMRATVTPAGGRAAAEALARAGDPIAMPPAFAATSVPRWAPLVDVALLFDGVDDRVVADTPAALKEATSWTFGFWMRPAPTAGTTAAGAIAGLDGADAAGAAWVLGAGQQLTVSYAGAQNVLSLAHYFREWTDPVPAGFGDEPLSRWRWMYVSTVYDGAAMSLTTLVNGGELMDTVFLASSAAPPSAGQVTFGFGGAPAGPFYAGLLSRVTLWRRALSAYEVGDQMRSTMVGGKVMGMPDLVGAWRMDEGYGAVAFDYASLPGSGGLLGAGDADQAPEWTVADPLLMPI
jgi:hypothetical protein